MHGVVTPELRTDALRFPGSVRSSLAIRKARKRLITTDLEYEKSYRIMNKLTNLKQARLFRFFV